jgi:two-component system, NtrC family, response regulator PilR
MDESGITVLLVEDDGDLRTLLGRYLARMGIDIQTAGNLADAVKAIQSEEVPFGIVFTDLRLPDGTGLDVVRTARTRSAETLVTVVTGYASMETAIESIRAGAYDYISKPVLPNELGVHLRNMVERLSLSRENARLGRSLQGGCEQMNQLQNERTDMLKYQEQILGSLRQATAKLDELLCARNRPGAKTQNASPRRV